MVYLPADLPPELRSPDATIPEVMAFRHESARMVFYKIQRGIYVSHKNRDRRLITWESVIADRERCLQLGSQVAPPPTTGKRKRGRPRKSDCPRQNDDARHQAHHSKQEARP